MQTGSDQGRAHFHMCLPLLGQFVPTLGGHTVYFADPKLSWNKPHQKDSGRGLCGTVTHHMKPPEPRCGFSFTVCVHASDLVYVCVSVCAVTDIVSALDVAWRTPAIDKCRPQQWDQGCFGDIHWQQCPDTEHGL